MTKNWKQKIRTIFLFAICIMGVCGIRVKASEGTIFHVENQTGKAGDTVTVPVEMKDGKEVGGFEITVYYDSETLEFQDLQKGNLVEEEGGLFDYHHKAEDASVKIVYVVADTVKSEGVIANLTFQLKKDCESALPIGMGVDEVIDNSAESNEITGQVSGVNENFQEQVDVQRPEETMSAVEGKEEKEGSDEEKSIASQIKENKTANSKQTEQSRTEKSNKVYAAVAGVVVMAGAIFIFWISKTRKHRKK